MNITKVYPTFVYIMLIRSETNKLRILLILMMSVKIQEKNISSHYITAKTCKILIWCNLNMSRHFPGTHAAKMPGVIKYLDNIGFLQQLVLP